MAERPSAAVEIPDAHLLFSGNFERIGVDLILSDQLHRVIVPNYFRDQARPLLVSPEGAHLDPGVVDALTGHTLYAQAGAPAAGGKVVGHVVKITGSASIVRNGVTIVANVGDAINQNDVVQTGSGSTLGLVLDDGTTFNLSANARFMLNELTYDASSTSNSSLMTLVQGAASFVAGQVAKTGDMRVSTPTATIGIRGTAVILDVSATDGRVSVSVVDQRDGLVHAVQVFNTAGVLIGTVTSNGSTLTLTPTTNFDVIAQQSNKTTDQVAQEFGAFQQVLSTYDSAKQLFPNLPQHTENKDNNNKDNTNPNSTTKFAGSPPLQPPGTEYHSATGTSPTQQASAAPTVSVTVNPASDTGTSSTAKPVAVDPIIIPVKLSAVPFVVTPPNVAAITSGAGDHIGPVMSANGDVVYDPDGAIYFFSHETGATTTIASPANGWSYGSPTISSDGRYIVYQGSDGTGSFVFVYGTDPSDPAHYHVQTQLAPGSAPAVSGDGSTIVAQDGGNIAIYGLDGTLKGTITPGAVGSSGALWKPAISADGHLIVFWNSDATAPGGSGRLLAFDLSTGELADIASTSAGAGAVAPTISADGRLIAYQLTDSVGHSEIYLYDLNAGAVVFHTSNASGSSYSPVLSPDGHFIVFTSEAKLVSADQNGFADIYIVDVTNPADPAYRMVSDGVGTASNGGAAISAGGQYVAFGNSSNIFFADPTSGLSAIILETTKSPDVLTTRGSIAVTGDYTGVTVSVSDQFGGATPYFSASFDANGHINWSFAEPKSDFAALSFGETATQEFIIKLTADNGYISIPVFVTVHDGVQPTIQKVDAAPVAAPVTLVQGQQDNPYVITPTALLRGAADIDGPSLSISSLTIQSGGGGLVLNGDQTWTYTPDPGFSGRVVFGYTVTDTIKSATSTASLNITLPLAITAISPDSGVSGDFVTNSTQLSVSGTNGALSPDERIQVSSDNGLTWSDAVQTSATTWSLTDPGAHNANFSYQVRVVDAASNTIGSATRSVTIDTDAPTVTIDTASALTNQASQRISGTVDLADAGTTVIVFDNAQAVAGAVVQSDGSWSVIVSLSEGGNSFVAQDTDAAGNLGSSNTVVLTLDSTPPAAIASVGALSADSGTSAIDFNTNVTSQTISGTYTGALGAGEVIQVSVNNGFTWVTAAASGGAWSASGVPLSPGTNLLSVRTIDLAGNITAGTGHSYTLDTVAPTAVATVTLLSSDSGSSATDFVTNISSQTVSGTYTSVLAFGETIQVSADGGVTWVAATANAANNTWSASGMTLSPAGTTLSVRTIDLAGNIAAGTSHSYSFDTVAPSAIATVTALGSDSGSSSSDFVTNVASQTVSGTYSGALSAGESIQVSADGATWVTAVANAANGTWSASGVTLSAAGSTLSVRAIDLAGNSLAGTGHGYTLDTGAPTAAATVTALSADSGSSSNDFVTNVASQTVTGTYTGALGLGESIQLSVDGTTWVTANAAGGAWSAPVILSGGGSLLSVRTIDLAGNIAAGTGHGYTLDQTVPSGGTPDLIAGSDSGSSSSDNNTNILAPTLTVALGAGVAVGDTVQLLLNGSSFSHPLVRTVTSGDIAAQSVGFTVSPGDLGADGPKLISARFSDLAGNSSTSAALTITLDTSAPVLAIANAGGNTNQPVQTISGTADPADAGAIVTVLDDGASVVGVATIQANGSWSTDVTLHSDSNSLTAQATDAAGNQGVSNTVIFVLNTNAPTGGTPDLVAASDSGNSSSDNTTNVIAPTFSVALGANVAAGDTIQLLLNGVPLAHPVTHTISAADIGAQSASLTVTGGDLGSDGAKSISAKLTDGFGNSSTTAALIITLDTAAPTVSSEAITSATGAQNSTLNAGDVVSVTVSFSEAVTVTGTPQLALNIGGTPVQANYASGSGSTQLVFTYTIQAGQNDVNGISLDANALSLNGGTIADAAGNAAVLTAAAVADNASYKVDTTAPTVSSEAITSATGAQSSTLNAGDVVSVTVTFSESVTVTGTPQLALNIGGTPVQAAYASGSGSNQLVFTYTVLAGQNDANGISLDANALSLNGGTIADAAGNAAVLTAAAVTDNASYKVDTAAPTVSSEAITSATSVQNSTLNVGDVVSITVSFSESVTVTGTPQLALNIGGTPVQAAYASGSGSTQLVFTYTILAGQNDANGISLNANALSLNGGTITDAAGNAAVLTAAAVADNTSYKVDTAAPTVSSEVITSATGSQNSTLNAGDVASVTVTFSESVTVTGTPQLALNIGGTPVQAAYASGSGSTQLVFTYTIQPGQNDANGISLDANALTLNGGTVMDAAGNAAVLTAAAVADNASYKVDTAAPAVSSEAITSATGVQNSTLNAGDVVSVIVTFNESVTVTGTPQLALNVGGTPVQANYASGSGSTQLVFTYTIQAGQNDANGISIDANTLSLNGGTITDAAGNAAVLTAAAVADNPSFKVDTAAPTVSSEAIISATGVQNNTLNAGDVVSITVSFSESVTVTGTPQLALNIGGTPVQAAYASGSGSTQLVFTYTILAGQNDANGISLDANALSLNGGTITDAAGNAAVLTAAAVADNASFKVDTATLAVSSEAITSATGVQNSTLNADDVVSITVSFSESVTVTGTPQLALNIGGTPVQANYASGSGSTQLVFTYTILAGQNDANGISIDANALSLNGGTITNAAGNAAVLTAAAVADNAGYKVDTAAPTVSSEAITSATGAQNSTLNAGDVVSVTVTFSESVTVTGTPQLALNIGGTPVQAAYASGSGSAQLVFTYTILAGQNDPNGISINANALSLNGGTITDAAGNAAMLTAAAVTDNANYKVDTAAPTVSSEAITSATGVQNSTLNAGDVVSVTVTFGEAVTVTGTPQLALNVGGTPVQAAYASGSGSTQLVFTYTIQAGQNDANGISIDANALSLNGGTITDAAGNAAVLTAAAVADNASYKVDTAAPTVSSEAITSATGVQNSTLNAGDVVSITVSFSESVTVTGTPQLALNIGGTPVQAAYASGSGSTQLVFTYTIQAGQNDSNGISLNANALSLNGGTITDAAGNAAVLTAAAVADNASYKVDTAAPTVSSEAITSATGAQNSTLNAGDVVSVTVTFSEAVTVTGTPQLALNVGGTPVQASYASGSGSTQLVFTYTILAGQNDANGIGLGANALSLNGGTITDAAGNTAVLTAAAVADNASYKVDTAAPTVSSGAITSATGVQNNTLNAGDVVSVTVTFNESVTVTGTPQLTLNIGGTSVQAAYASGSGSAQLVFTYTIQAGQNDANGISIDANALSLNGGTITDAAGNAAVLTAAAVADNAGYVVDTGSPIESLTIASIAGSSSSTSTAITVTGTNGTLAFGDKVQIGTDNATWTDVVRNGPTKWTFTDSTVRGSGFTYFVRVVDSAGNASVPVTLPVLVASGGATVPMTAAGGVAEFTGSGGTLQIGAAVTGTINAISIASGPVAIGGSGNVTSSAGDAIDLYATGASAGNPANLTVNPTGQITGAGSGISVIQNAAGSITVTTSGPVVGQAGRGILAQQNGTGTGSILINGSGNVTGTGAAFSGIVAVNLNSANNSDITVSQSGNVTGGHDGIRVQTNGNGNEFITTGTNAIIQGLTLYGIEAQSKGRGSITITTGTGGSVTSAGVGIFAYNEATSIPQNAGVTTSTISVTANGTIHSGFELTGNGSRPAGILAGYKGGTNNTVNPSVFGNVLINNSAAITASGGDGIRGFNYGSGDVSINQLAGSIVARDMYGITGVSLGSGNVAITTADNTSILSGSHGILAINQANAIATLNSTVTVTARGSIATGVHLSVGGAQSGGISAGFWSTAGAPNTAVNGTVLVDNYADVTARVAFGIVAYNVGYGDVTVYDRTGASVSGVQSGINASSSVSGTARPSTVTINVEAGTTVSSGTAGVTGINANNTSGGNISITAAGDVVSGGTGINANAVPANALSSSQILINAAGSVTSGYNFFQFGNISSGISAGYGSSNGQFNAAVHGSVVLSNAAVVSGAATGINLYNFGVGDIQATLLAGSVAAGLSGVNAFAQGGGSVTIDNRAAINAGAIGINAGNGTSNSAATGTVSVINSGTVTAPGAPFNPVVNLGNSNSGQFAIVSNTGTIRADLFTRTTGNTAINMGSSHGAVTNSGTIYGNVSLNGTSSFTNAVGGVWNLNGQNVVSGSLSNNGTMNISGVATLSAGSFSQSSTGSIDLLANGAAQIYSSIAGSGIITLEDRSVLQFSGSGAVSPTLRFNGKGLLSFDNPASLQPNVALNFAGAGFANIGDIITLSGANIAGDASLNLTGSTLTVTGATQSYTFQVSGQGLTGNTFYMLSPDRFILAPSSAIVNPAFNAVAPTSSSFYIVTNAISGTGTGFSLSTTDAAPADAYAVAIRSTAPITMTGAGAGVAVSTAGASAAIVNAAAVSSGGAGLSVSVSSSTGGADVIDYGSVSAAQTAIFASTTNGTVNVNFNVNAVTESGVTLTGTSTYGIFGRSTGSGGVNVLTTGGTINAGLIGILAVEQQSSPGPGGNVQVYNSSTINSGSNPSNAGTGPAGIRADIFNNNTSTPNPLITGDVTVEDRGNITAQAGAGIFAANYGSGNTSVTLASGWSITATAAGTTPTNQGLTQYGIFAFTYGTGSSLVDAGWGTTITSGSTGINAGNQSTSIGANSGSTVAVYSQGFISSGASNNNSGSAPSAIQAGYNPSNAGAFSSSVHGDVIVNVASDGNPHNNPNPTILAARGSGINAYNYGIGDVTVTVGTGVSIQALLPASGATGGGIAPYGIGADNRGPGNIVITTFSGSSINAGSSGISANNGSNPVSANDPAAASAAAPAVIAVTAAGTIQSGSQTTNGGGTPSGVSAGFLGGTSAHANLFVNGNVLINNAATVTAAGFGLQAYDYGNGDIVVNNAIGANVTSGSHGIYAHAEGAGTGDVSVTVYGNTTTTTTIKAGTPSSSAYGILAFSTNAGDISVVTSVGDTIDSQLGSAGINAVNEATSIAASVNSSVVVTNAATVHSGIGLTAFGQPGGILAGYIGGTTNPSLSGNVANYAVNGEVVVNNFGDVTADAGDGIRAYNYGVGDVTINNFSGNITALGGANPPNGTGVGLLAQNYGPGSVYVTTSASTSITSGSTGIAALNKAISADPANPSVVVPATTEVFVNASGTIHSGTTPTGTVAADPAAGILAGYNPNNQNTANPAVHGNVLVHDHATIVAPTGTDGIRAVNYGTGDIAVIVDSDGRVFAGRYGVAAFGFDEGDVSVTIAGSVIGGTAGLDVTTTGAGTVTIDNAGVVEGIVIGYNATFTNEAGADWQFSDASGVTGVTTLANAGTIESNGASSLLGLTSFTNTGTIAVESGSLTIGTAVTGGGTAVIYGASLAFNAASDTNVVFDKGITGTPGTLVLADAADFTGSVTGFVLGDTIDLVGIAPASVSVSGSGGLHVEFGTGSFALIGSYDPTAFLIASDGQGGTNVTWNHNGPVIDTSHLAVNFNSGTYTVTGIHVTDSDPAVPTAPVVTYTPGPTPPASENVALSLSDIAGAAQTVNFFFQNGTGSTVQGTSGNDVIFAASGQDVLTGGGGRDQFVFAAPPASTPVQHTITDFAAGIDKLDVRQFANVSWASATDSPNDTLVTLDANDSILLKNIVASHLKAGDFIFV
ncbi:Ig-like domain-containing protein [Bradyrhizobium stylosanthis]|nr:Ig-like domain-containing protein [Bradyrhizobium stylosanthis]